MKTFSGVFLIICVMSYESINAHSTEDEQLMADNETTVEFTEGYVTEENDDIFNTSTAASVVMSDWPTIVKRKVLEGTFNANLFVDIALQGLRVYMSASGRNREPIQLPEYHLDANRYDVYLKEGRLLTKEFPELLRNGENTVDVSNESLTFNMKVRIGRTEGMYNKLKAKTRLFRKTYKLNFQIDSMEASMQIVLKFTNLNVFVKDCEITEIGKIHLDVHGSFSRVADWLGTHKVNKDSFKKEIANDMKGEMKKFIQEELDQLFPNNKQDGVVTQI